MMRRLALILGASLALGAIIWGVAFYEKSWSHGNRMAVEAELFAAANGPGGPDYQREIEIVLKNFPDDDNRKLNIAAATMRACDEKKPPCLNEPGQTRARAQAQLTALARNATDADVRSAATRWLDNKAAR